jgi:hypothetical protein
MKILSVVSELLHVDRYTDMALVAFLQLYIANTPNTSPLKLKWKIVIITVGHIVLISL